MGNKTPPFIEVGTEWEAVHLSANLVALGIEAGDQLVVTNKSSKVLHISEGDESPTDASGYIELHRGDIYVTSDFATVWAKGSVGPCKLLVEYAP